MTSEQPERAKRLDPIFADRLHLLNGITSIEQALQDPEQTPRLLEFMTVGEISPASAVRRRDVLANPDQPRSRYRIYEPEAHGDAEPAAVLVWVHGGGFTQGSVDDPPNDALCANLAESGLVVVAIDYRLAAEGVSYPIPHDDVVEGVRWVRDHIEEIGGDSSRISVGGDSAGGNLALGAALRLRDEDRWAPAALIAAYPIVHPVLPPYSVELRAAMIGIPEVLRFLPDDVERMNRTYLGDLESAADGYAMPGLADLRGLCPVLIIDAECDDLRASGEELAVALVRAGVDVHHVIGKGMLHAFLMLPDVVREAARARRMISELVRAGGSRVTSGDSAGR